jgi:hypothetical protein
MAMQPGQTKTQNGKTYRLNENHRWELVESAQSVAARRTPSKPAKPHVTETPQFKAWFGDSKVVDENGKPLVVYHGTGATFDTFDTTGGNDLGSHFGTAAQASDFTHQEGGQIKPMYLKIASPLRLRDLGRWGFDELKPELAKLGITVEDSPYRPETADSGENYRRKFQRQQENISKALKSAGYDGIVYRNENEGGDNANSYIIFEPMQAKSATGNRGTFDPSTGNILLSTAPRQTKKGSILDRIVGRSLIASEGAAQTVRTRIMDALWKKRSFPIPQILAWLPTPLGRFRTFVYRHIRDSFLYSWTAGMDYLYRNFPPWLAKEFETTIRQTPPQKPPKPPFPRFTFFDESDDALRFPLIEIAAKRLAERNIMTRQQWEAVDKYAQERAFFITAPISTDTIDRIRNVLVYDVDEGTSRKGFEKAVSEALDGSPIGRAHLENVYRTNLQAAFRDGRETLASNPIVAAAFPYQAYDAIRDTRVRHDHLEMESLGLDGTNVFRRDDPVWDYFTPPWDYNCRCGVNLLTIDAAARAGVREAKEWLRTGKPPIAPEYRISEVLKQVRPNPNFGSRGLVYA